MSIIGQAGAILKDPVVFCYLGLVLVYLTVAVASWRMRHRLHAGAYVAAAILVGTIAACAMLKH